LARDLFSSIWLIYQMLIAMIEATGKVTEVCKFSRLEDQITILVSIPSAKRGEGEFRSLDWVVPAGTVKVGTTVKVAFIDKA
jgi:hypothetical protein